MTWTDNVSEVPADVATKLGVMLVFVESIMFDAGGFEK